MSESAFFGSSRTLFSLLIFLVPMICSADDPSRPANRLAAESSPYLLLHAHNPVDWYPWGPEALERAKREDKPIFLSIGYSSCYWCHVMERKVFSNERIAKFMNEHFVNIKVDREERPDVDDIYMTGLLVYQQLAGNGGGGGWPLSLFLTPEGDPIAGATYLPPEDTPDGRTGFLTAAGRISELWGTRRADLQRTAKLVSGEVRRLSLPAADVESVALNDKLVQTAVNDITSLYDPEWGGVDFDARQPDGARFPNVPRLQLLLDIYEQTDDPTLLKIVNHSLTSMARGGIRDHLAGGFHRYSTDRRWHVPHFEKMLYDQAQLLSVYSRAAAVTNDPLFRTVSVEIADFVRREMTTPQGAFSSALDAETNAIEGKYYVWTKEEVTEALGAEDAGPFCRVYGMNDSNSFEHGFVLHLPQDIAAVAKEIGIPAEELEARLQTCRSKLLELRSKRERPLLDDKVLTAWNAMMIQSLAESGRLLDRHQDIASAASAADFLLKNLRDDNGHLQRTWRAGEARYQAYLDDYAFLTAALLELHRATGEARWLQEATELAGQQVSRFYDADLHLFYFTASDHENLIARTSPVYDSVFPSGNSVTIRNLLKLTNAGTLTDAEVIAESMLQRFAPMIEKSPASTAGLAAALNDWLRHSEKQAAAEASAPQISTRPAITPQARPLVAARYRLAVAEEGATGQTPADDLPVADDGNHDETIEQTAFRPVLPAVPQIGGFNRDEKLKPLTVKIYPMYDKLPRGEKVLIALELQIKDGWHINSNPSSPDFLKPTLVKLTTKQKVKLTRIKYPKHKELEVIGSDEPYHVYDGHVIVYGLLEIDAAETAEKAELEFEVAFQACNERECLPPDKVVMKGKLPLANPGDPIRKIHADKFPKPKKDGEGDEESENPDGDLSGP
ncbi:MAG: DUF255 domain-containing protein [Planctomycetaceae bacterium]